MQRRPQNVGNAHPTREPNQQAKPGSEQAGETIELRAEALEERIAPKLASNHNETLLVDR